MASLDFPHTTDLSKAPTKFDCVILNGTVVTATDIGSYDIGIRDGKIQVLATSGSLNEFRAGRVIDAKGAYVTVYLSDLPVQPHREMD